MSDPLKNEATPLLTGLHSWRIGRRGPAQLLNSYGQTLAAHFLKFYPYPGPLRHTFCVVISATTMPHQKCTWFKNSPRTAHTEMRDCVARLLSRVDIGHPRDYKGEDRPDEGDVVGFGGEEGGTDGGEARMCPHMCPCRWTSCDAGSASPWRWSTSPTYRRRTSQQVAGEAVASRHHQYRQRPSPSRKEQVHRG